MARAKRLPKRAYDIITRWGRIESRIRIGKIPEEYRESADLLCRAKLEAMGVDPDSRQVINYKNISIDRFFYWMDLDARWVNECKKNPEENGKFLEKAIERYNWYVRDFNKEEWDELVNYVVTK